MSNINRIKKGLLSFVVIPLTFITGETASAVTLELTQQQKEDYYKQYVEIVDKAMTKKVGIHLEVSPIDEFQDEFWVEPKEFEKTIQKTVDQHLALEREKLASLSHKEAVMNGNGETSKKTYIYVPDTTYQIEVTGNFETQYNDYNKRQLLANVDNILSKVISDHATWEQTSIETSMIDGGRSISVRIEGVLHTLGVSFEKAFTVEFHCDESGKIL